MHPTALAEALSLAVERLGGQVRTEPFEAPARLGGGLCWLRGQPVVLLDAGASLDARIQVLARAVATLGSDRVYLVPEVRALVDLDPAQHARADPA
jgi:hypothetical protein